MERYVVRVKFTSRTVESFEPFRTTPTIGGRLTKRGVVQRALLFYSEIDAYHAIDNYLKTTTVKRPPKFSVYAIQGKIRQRKR